jgi:hypothetical protein
MYLPGWDPSQEPPTPRSTLSHAAMLVQPQSRWLLISPRLRHIHLTDGSRLRTSTPAGDVADGGCLWNHLAETPVSDGEIILEINTRRCSSRRSARRICVSRWTSRAPTPSYLSGSS